VALKVRTFASQDRVRLMREVRALRRLHHPGVARLVAHGMDGDVAWIAMEYVDGETLRARDARGWAAVGRHPAWMPLFRRLCEALAHVHEHGIAHGDLKPENIVIAAGGQPVLVDFGFAARLADPVGRVLLGDTAGTAGTPAYMAPEQLAGHEPDVRTDLWSLGAILHELATGAPPRRGIDSERSLAEAPLRVRDVLGRLLAPGPRDRFGHALDVLAALDAAELEPGPTPVPLFAPSFRGRDDFIDWAVGAVSASRAGRGTLACITGSSGIGKSRALAEVMRIAAPRMRVVTAGASPLGGQHTGVGQAGNSLVSALLDAIGEAHPTVQRLRDPLPGHGGDGAGDRIARELLNAIGALAVDRPLAILLDDLQWADERIRALLRAVPDGWATSRPLLWICAAREGVSVDAWRRRRDVVSFALGPLDPDATAVLVRDALALDAIGPGIAEQLHASASGNPLRVLESVRLGLDEGWLRRLAPGRLVAATDADALPIPATLDVLMRRRLRDIGGRERALLEAGAVLGRSFTDEVACEAAGVRGEEGIEALAELLARDVFVADGVSGEVSFANDALAEQIYAAIAPDARRVLHARAAAALAVSGDARPGLDAVLAHHWALAGDVVREHAARGAAAEESLARAAFEEARTHLTRLFELDAHPDAETCRSDATTRARWHVERSRCAHALADPDAMDGEARAALALLDVALPETERDWWSLVARRLLARLAPLRAPRDLEGIERARLAARAADVLVHNFYYGDDLPAMIGSALVATRAAERAGDVALAARSWMVLASLCGLLRLHDAAERHFARGQAAALRDGDRSEQAYCLATRAVYHANFGDFGGAREAVRLAEQCLEGVDDPFQREIVVTMRGHVAHFTGRHAEARSAFEEVLASALARGNVQREAWGRFSIARTDLAQGRDEAALRELEAARGLLARAPELQSEVICFGLLACARLRCGDADGALHAARDAEARIARARPSGFPSVAGYAALAETWSALAARGAAPEIERAQRRHRSAFRGFVRLFPMARPAYEQALARDLAARGADWRARRHLRRAAARARAFGMTLPEAP
jgi:tetratricopeptide (TPR) repeat protein